MKAMKKALLTAMVVAISGQSFAHEDSHSHNHDAVVAKPVMAKVYKPSWNIDVFGGKQRADTLGWGGGDYKTDSGNIFGVGLSKRVSTRTELGFELSGTKNHYSGFPNYLSGRAAMFTAKYDFVQRGGFSAYGGVGLGLVRASYSQLDGQKFAETVAGGQATLGMRFAVSPRAKLFVEARRVASKDFSIAGAGSGAGLPAGSTAEYEGNSVVLGFRYSF